MGYVLFRLLFWALLVGTAVPVSAQEKAKSKKVKKGEVLPQKDSIVRYAEVGTSADRYEIIPPNDPPAPPPPMELDFDTTEVPNDQYTAKVRELLGLVNSRQMVINELEQTFQRLKGEAGNQTPSMQQWLQVYRDRMLAEMTSGRGARWMERMYVRHYRAVFTLEELQTAIDFYRTTSGQKMLLKNTELLSRVFNDAQKMGQYLAFDILQQLQKEQNGK